MEYYNVCVPKKLVFRSDWVKYLIVFWKELAENISYTPSAEFRNYVEKEVASYLHGGKPPEAIAGAVMNIADDIASGREITLRAGDYIALQTQFKGGK